MGGDDDRSYLDREKLSYSELDRMRRERRQGHDSPRGPGAQKRTEEDSKQYLKQIDGLFSPAQGGADGERLAGAMREARGTPGLGDACRAYRDAVGMPGDVSLLGLFLDSGDAELIVAGIDALEAVRGAGGLQATPGLRTQLRMLAEDSRDDVAGAAEDLLEAL